eukprot:TRINITY_DN6783_c0_g2_i2.p1 TRINITY_DN6783_c0_g2~~TRINITY_DN6783_c0_g2_i2.p1  ORF type:complete len:604 (+),score=141.28 TRINITY_DN6783_c0_g2_i2:60-1814(+)
MAWGAALLISAGCAWAVLPAALPAHLEVEHREWKESLVRDWHDLRRRYPDHDVTMLNPTIPHPAAHGYYLSCPRRRECKCKDLSCGTCENLPCIDIWSNDPAPVNGTSCCCERPLGYYCNLFTTPEDGKCGSVCCREATPAGARATLCGGNKDAVCCAPYRGQQYDCGYLLARGVMAQQGGCCIKKGSSLNEMTDLKCCEHGVGWDCLAARHGRNETCCLAHKQKLPKTQAKIWNQPFERDEPCQPPNYSAPYDWRLACYNYTTFTMTPTETLPVRQESDDWMARVGAYVVPVAVCSGVFVLLCIAIPTWYMTCQKKPPQLVVSQPAAAAGNREATFESHVRWFDPNSERFVRIEEEDAPDKLPSCVALDWYTEAKKEAKNFSINGVEGVFGGGLMVLGVPEELLGPYLEAPKPRWTLRTDKPRRAMLPDGAVGIDGRSGGMFCQEWHIGVPDTAKVTKAFGDAGKIAGRGLRATAAGGICMAMAEQGKSGCVAFLVSQDNTLFILISSGSAAPDKGPAEGSAGGSSGSQEDDGGENGKSGDNEGAGEGSKYTPGHNGPRYISCSSGFSNMSSITPSSTGSIQS